MTGAKRFSAGARPGVVVMGPGSSQVGGLATFVEFLFGSPRLQTQYRLMHLDTTRGARGVGRAGALAAVNMWYLARQMAQLVWVSLRQRPRLLHAPVNSFWPFWKDAAFILLGRALGLKVIAHLHGGAFERYYAGRPPYVKRLIRWVLSQSDVVIALSERWRRFLVEGVGVSAPVEVAPNAVDAAFAAASETVSYGPEREPGAVLFVGALERNKGVLDILRAAPLVVERHAEAHFLLAGTADVPSSLAQIERACAEANLDQVVRFLGRVEGQAKLNLYLRAALFVLPSYNEGLPYVLLEAMCAGLPIVATSVGAIPELIRDGQNGFVIEPGDHEALAERIVRLLDDPALRLAMSQANVATIRNGYLPDIAARRIEAIYRGLLEPDARDSEREDGARGSHPVGSFGKEE